MNSISAALVPTTYLCLGIGCAALVWLRGDGIGGRPKAWLLAAVVLLWLPLTLGVVVLLVVRILLRLL